MIEKELALVNKRGLHARSASSLVACASVFSSDIRIAYKEKNVSAKKIMELMMLGAKFQEKLIVRCEGKDEVEALAAIEKLVADRFGEDE